MPLGENSLGRKALMDCAGRSSQPYWLIRFAHLLSEYGFPEDSARCLNRIDDLRGLNAMHAAKAAEIKNAIGQRDAAQELLGYLLAKGRSLSYPDASSVARASAMIGLPALAAEAFRRMVASPENPGLNGSLEYIHLALLSGLDAGFASECLGQLEIDSKNPKSVMLHGIVRHRMGSTDGMKIINRALAELPKDYHSLGWAGNVLMRAGHVELATRCLKTSGPMNPNNFMHHEFIGTVYFDAEQWDLAAGHLEAALEIIPYMRQVRAKALYSRLPQEYRKIGMFSNPRGICMIFQTNQAFYSHIFHPTKPITQYYLR